MQGAEPLRNIMFRRISYKGNQDFQMLTTKEQFPSSKVNMWE